MTITNGGGSVVFVYILGMIVGTIVAFKAEEFERNERRRKK